MENLLNILFPPKCLFCGRTGVLFCPQCLESCQLFNKTRSLNFNGLKMYAPFKYMGLVRNCIRYSKYSRKQFKALKILAASGARIAHSKFKLQNYIVVPIPLSTSRYAKRGFNQARIIAQQIAQEYCLPLRLNTLIRVRDTKVMYKLDKAARKKNLENAFAVCRDIEGKNILLVDDIGTSGSTFREAAKTLKKAGAKEVMCFALCFKL